MDVSGSMRATDVEPNRLVAAQNAAKAFLKDLPRDVKVGIVAFAGSAQVAQLPTVNRDGGIADTISRAQVDALLKNCNTHGIRLFGLGDP